MSRKPKGRDVAAPLASPGPGAALRHPFALPLLATVGAILVAYSRMLSAGFVWDDAAHVTSPALATWAGLRDIWFSPGATQQYYPLLHSAFWVELHLWGGAAPGYHLLNILLHAGVAGLLYRTLTQLRMPGAAFGAACFALHPTCVESVAWISEQKNTLSTLLYFASALAYLRFDRGRHARWYLAATVLFLMALAAKTVTATLPAALLVVFWWQRGKLAWRRDIAPLAPWFLCSAAAAVMTAWMERTSVGAHGAAYANGGIERCLIAGHVVWFYLGKLLFPSDLMFIYPRWVIDAHAPAQYVYPVALLAALGGLFALRKKSRAPLAAALLFVGTLFPALGFIDVYPFAFSHVADHFQYLAAALLVPALAAGATVLAERAGPSARPARLIAAVGFVAGLGFLSWLQTADYADSDTLWRRTLARNPDCWMACNNLGADLLQAGKLDEAVPLLERGSALAPTNGPGWTNLGTARHLQGREDEAVACFRKALELEPESVEALATLGSAEVLAGKFDDARRHLEAALAREPAMARAHIALGNLLIERGRFEEALAHYRTAAAIDPNEVEAHTNAGTALARLGRLDEAIAAFMRAEAVDPQVAAAHVNLGNALLQKGRLAESIGEFNRALALDPRSALTHNNLGLALLAAGRPAEAAAQFETALGLQPGYDEARRNLATARSRAGTAR